MNIVFVCHANRFRSPFAEIILRSLKPSWSIVSAGVKGEGYGLRAGKPSRDEATLRKLSLEDHRSQKLTNAMVEDADYVFYMDGGNLVRLGGWPSGNFKCLAEPIGEKRIPDPAFISDRVRRGAIYQMIEQACKEIANW